MAATTTINLTMAVFYDPVHPRVVSYCHEHLYDCVVYQLEAFASVAQRGKTTKEEVAQEVILVERRHEQSLAGTTRRYPWDGANDRRLYRWCRIDHSAATVGYCEAADASN